MSADLEHLPPYPILQLGRERPPNPQGLVPVHQAARRKQWHREEKAQRGETITSSQHTPPLPAARAFAVRCTLGRLWVQVGCSAWVQGGCTPRQRIHRLSIQEDVQTDYVRGLIPGRLVVERRVPGRTNRENRTVGISYTQQSEPQQEGGSARKTKRLPPQKVPGSASADRATGQSITRSNN